MPSQTHQLVELDADLVNICLIYDGTSTRVLGNFLGLYGIPPQGDYYWYAVNGDHGDATNEQEAIREIMEAWGR